MAVLMCIVILLRMSQSFSEICDVFATFIVLFAGVSRLEAIVRQDGQGRGGMHA